MGASTGPQGGPWFRVPATLPALEPEEALAWVVLLGLWHGGHDPSIGEMRRRTGWGAGRMTAFMSKVSSWAAENGAAMPVRRAELKRTLKNEGDGNVIGTAAERQRNVIGTVEPRENADNKLSPERERNDTGTAAECYRNDSRARVPSSEKNENQEETQSARKPHPGWTSLPPLPPVASPVEIQPEADPELDAHLAAVFAPEADPVAPPPKKPLFACWAETPKPAVVEEEPEEEDPLPADHLLLLTTRPDGSPALSMAVAAPLATALLSGGYATPADLELATMDDVAKVVGGKQKMNLINQSLVAWGTKLLLSTRAMVEDIRARARAGKLDLSPVEEFLLKKAHIKLSEVRDANDFACYTLMQRIDAARSTL